MRKLMLIRMAYAGGALIALAGLAPAAQASAVQVRAVQPGAAAEAAGRVKPPLRHLVRRPTVTQLITVTATSRATSYATFRAYQVTDGKRTEVFGPWTARVGYNGIAAPGGKREGDGRTPSGSYGFAFFFGVAPDPGTAFPYRRAYAYDYWDDDPRSPRYNEWTDARSASPGRAPEPLRDVPAYDYAAVIAYNTARAPGLGSAIFLHVGTGSATAGCVSLPAAELLKVLRWLNPAAIPRIAISAS